MTFSRVVCWNHDRVYSVMNTQAEYAEDDVFLAVHSQYQLTLRQTTVSLNSGNKRLTWSVPPEQFLTEFLAQRDGNYQPQVVVIGGSGSGKSHLIHWLKTRIPATDERYVLTIPKSGTSLRGVIRQLLAILPDDQARHYQKQLEGVGQHDATTASRRERLIAEIALAISRSAPTAPAGDTRDLEEFLIESLPAMFNDPEMRPHWREDDSTIGRLAAHIEEHGQDHERLTQQRAFTVNDLPLSGMQTARMARPTQDLLNELRGSPELSALAVEVINRNLDDAILHVLNFTGDELVNLMLDIRRYLRRQGKELVLLIEDFARVQGVDRALLQALIELPGTGPDALCTMRWAMAATSGYYERLLATVMTRITHVIDMDVPQAALGAGGLAGFTSRYLNAVRLPAASLQAWHAAGADPDLLPNRCTDCEYRSECHPAFGEVDGVGLYPFNTAALHTMAARKNPDIADRFNPRSVVGPVLAEVLDRHTDDVAQGAFPPDALLRSMGNSELPTALESRLQQADPEHFHRQRATLELWGVPGTPVALPETVYQAFDLPAPKIELAQAPPLPPVGPDAGGSGGTTPAPLPSDINLVELREWAAGRRKIDSRSASHFRELLYEALESSIDWDAANLWQARFSSKSAGGRPFGARYIVFRNQVMNPPAHPHVLLQIPLVENDEGALRQAAIALAGLHQFRQRGSWEFEDGQLALVAVAECLEAWSADVVRQLRELASKVGEFQAVRAAAELLAVGATLSGRLGDSDAPAEGMNALFATWPQDLPAFSPEWRTLYREILRHRESLVEVVRSYASATKGGQAGPVLDAVQLRRVVARVRTNWKLEATVPTGVTGLHKSLQDVATLYPAVRSRLPAAVRAEQERRLSWLHEVRERASEGTRRRDLVEAIRLLQAKVEGEGLPVPTAVVTQLRTALSDFEGANFDAAVLAASLLADRENPLDVFPQLGKAPPNAMEVATRFFAASDRYLLEVERLVKGREDDLNRGTDIDIVVQQRRIRESLEQLDTMFQAIGGPTA